MEERIAKLQELYAEISGIMQEWMKEDMDKEARPASYSIDQSMMFMRTSYMWAHDAMAQEAHFTKNVAPKLELQD